MKLPRVRFTVRWLMIAVAVVAPALFILTDDERILRTYPEPIGRITVAETRGFEQFALVAYGLIVCLSWSAITVWKQRRKDCR